MTANTEEQYITVHQHLIEDETGDIVDAMYFCSDFCHRDYLTICHRDNYNGWNGCNEVMAPEWCANCGDQIK